VTNVSAPTTPVDNTTYPSATTPTTSMVTTASSSLATTTVRADGNPAVGDTSTPTSSSHIALIAATTVSAVIMTVY